MKKVTICVLLYGDYPHLARQCLDSIRRHCPPATCHLVVGGNALSSRTRSHVHDLQAQGVVHRFVDSPVNLNKNPMMRLMFEGLDSEYVWWFDDDSYIAEPDALARWLGAAERSPRDVGLWGHAAVCDHPNAFAPDIEDVEAYVRSASWYGGLPPPSWRPGGKGAFDFENKGTGDGRWFFVIGGCFLARTCMIQALDWPDRRLIKMGEDVLLGEAARQHGWRIANIGPAGVAIDTMPRRGNSGCVGVHPKALKVLA